MPFTGCAYYPEHWPRDRWEQDAQIMRDAGLTVVRVGEFAWDKFEPQEGVYDFAWMDEAVNILAEAGLKVIMCTPTPTPPPWLTHLHPEICRVREDGVRISPGGRRHACANVPAYLDYSERIVAKITEHYGQHPAVVGWQVDNEFGCGETTRCYCEHCRARFHRWLEEKYGTLDALNAAWGTQFWGMTYHDWAHIPIPGITSEPQSPGMRLDYRRFSSDSWVRFQKMHIGYIRENSPERPITHNFMIKHWSLDYWKLAEDLDFVSYDNYPHGLRGPAEVSMNFDLMRSFKRKPFWVMEQQPGRVNWHPFNPPVPEGQVRVWSHQAVAHGAEAVVYFRFRAGRFGQEQYHGGLLKWDATPDLCFYEAQKVAAEFEGKPELERPQAKVGIVFDYNDLWSIELEPHTAEFSYWNLVYEIYKVYWEANIPVDFLPRNADLTGYETVIVPAPILTHAGEAENWRDWVAAGGKLIFTFRSGVREPGNISVAETLPAGISGLAGVTVKRFMTAPPETYKDWPSHHPGSRLKATSPLEIDEALQDRIFLPTARKRGFFQMVDSTARPSYKIWAETLALDSAKSLFTYADGMTEGETAISVNAVGAGLVLYIGCWLDNWRLMLAVGEEARVQETLLHGKDGSRWRLIINHEDKTVQGHAPFATVYTREEA